MSANLKEDILKAAREAGHLEAPVKKVIKKPKYFIISFPNGAEALIKANGWIGITNYIKYFKDEYDEDIVAIAITKSEAFKFFLNGRLFNAGK